MPRRVAFFGATGGCANACLAYTLQGGHSAIALVRRPEVLREQLRKREIADEVVESQLCIVEGDVKDITSVAEVIANGGNGVDTIISGIGGPPTPQSSLLRPLTTTDPGICHKATCNILAALKDSKDAASTLLVIISANGVLNDSPRDYPLALLPLYAWLLRGVFDDKRAMETALMKTKPTGGYVVVRPSVLDSGPSKGMHSVREGTMEQPVQGYGIGRDDVGLWIYSRVVETEDRSALYNQGFQIRY
ncbi:hypothetical protein B0A55_11161 [Friedmanniomyces simplex]|uniref:NAD(P)-binding domain-containing protein n=1 Tax=Friedmanniomyces simplex TaxID=329884 RepID=A0A4U0X160_9PEZI|nr:hypothetical protein B0A55_11161 [Friedmanniomyces simplex]